MVLLLFVGLLDLRADGTDEPGRPAAGTGAAPAARAVLHDDAATAARISAVTDLLNRRAAAVRTRDRAAFLATIDPRSPDFAGRQAAAFDNLAAVPLSAWSYELDAGTQQPVTDAVFARYDAPVWLPGVVLRYGLAGVDREPTAQPQVFTFVQRGGDWFVGSDDDLAARGQPSWRGLWDLGPVVVARGVSSLVLAHPEQAAVLPEFVAIVDQAVPVVTSVWGPDWSSDVAVVVPQTRQEMSEVIGGDIDLDQIAAVATADRLDPGKETALGQRVVVNPANLDRLGPAGRQVVVQHEITHIATRASTAPDTARWLVEGFADYVGYLDSGIPVRSIAGELAAEVQSGQFPQQLPGTADFDGDNPRLGQAYQEAWLACVMISQRVGQDGLVAFYRQAAAGGEPALAAAVGAVLGTSYDDFVRDWRAFVADQLR